MSEIDTKPLKNNSNDLSESPEINPLIMQNLSSLEPLVKAAIEGLTSPQLQQIEAQRDIQIKQIEEGAKISHKQMDYDNVYFKHLYYLISAIIAVILLIALGLIFYKNESSLGIKVLSYAGILIMGFIAGFGAKSAIDKKNKS